MEPSSPNLDSRAPLAQQGVEASVADAFEAQVAQRPDCTAIIDGAERVTYAELNRRANRIANCLIREVEGPPARVAIFMSNSADFLAAIFGVLKAGHCYVPVDPSFPESRNAFILESSEAAAVITHGRHVDAVGMASGNGKGPAIVNVDALVADASDDINPGRTVSPDALAYIIYTSGSTGRPKGVIQNHRNLLHGCMRRTHLQKITPADRMTLFYSCSVMGSVYCIFGALLNGASLHIYDVRERGLDDLGPWLVEQGITIYHSVASIFRSFAQSHEGSMPESSIRLMIFGGERVLTADVAEARRIFTRRVEFFTGLGSTETGTIRHFPILEQTEVEGSVVPIGYAVDGVDVVLVDEDGTPVPEGEVGEIEVRSRYVALGYWNNPEATDRVFGEVPGQPGIRYYRMGDLAQLEEGGLLRHRGRKDFQVKIRGFRVELGEVEAALQQHPGVKLGVARAMDTDTGTVLVGYLVRKEGAAPITARELRAHMSASLPYYMVPSIFVELKAMPTTPNGKLDRKSLPDPTSDNQLAQQELVEPATVTERAVAGICLDLLGCDAVGVNQGFFELGGDSLSATRLLSRIHRDLGVKLSMADVFASTDLRDLAKRVDDAGAGGEARSSQVLSARPEGCRIPVTPAQLRMLLVDEISKGTSAYNITNSLRLRGPVDIQAFVRALQAVVARHSSFRTTFHADHDGYHQVLGPVAALQVPVVDLRGEPDATREQTALARVRDLLDGPMSLQEGPLFKCELLMLSEQDVVAAIVVNHIVYDNIWSSSIFYRELGVLYDYFRSHPESSDAAGLLPEATLEFADFAVWENRRIETSDFGGSLDYWRAKLKGAPATLAMPTDRPRPTARTFDGGVVSFEVPPELVPMLKDLVGTTACTPFMVFLAVWQLLLHRYSGQQDIIVGTPAGRRSLPETEEMIGLFINNLALRTQFDAGMSFRDLLAQVRGTSIEAFTHDDVPFEHLVRELKPARVTGLPPLFQHFFIYRNATHESWEIPGLDAEVVEVHQDKSKFDLTLSMREEAGGFAGTLEYSSDLFDADTAQRMTQHFLRLVEAVATRPDTQVLQAEMVGAAERQMLVETWNATATAYDETVPTHELFERMAQQSPSAAAIRTDEGTVSYGELRERVDQLAAVLASRGVEPGVLVGVCLDRTTDLVTALLATMKAGGAYVPLDPDFPPQRLAYMLEDSQAKLIVTEPRVVKRLGETTAEVVTVADALAAPAPDAQLIAPGPDDAAYVIYTSGSTGNPKGVQVTHRGLLNFLLSMRDVVGVDRADVVQSVTTICFDIAGLELYLPLIVGASVIVSPRETSFSGDALIASMTRHGATLLQATPATWRMLLQAGWRGTPSIKVLCGGEAMGSALAADLVATGCTVWNVYGPTETTIWSSAAQVRDADDSRFVGEPLANTQLFVMNDCGVLQPMGVPGELVIGGDGLALGYWRRQELTDEKFVPHELGSRGRIYRTGDLAIRRPNGRIEFLGRKDSQVKVRGFRIELGEVESALQQHPGVKLAAAGVVDDGSGASLVGYLVRQEDADPEALGARELRTFLGESLPYYMVPSVFVELDSLPMTPNGKLDRKALPDPGAAHRVAEQDLVEPGTPTEKALAGICRELLELDSLGINQSFFELGGDSLSATRMLSHVQRDLGVRLSMADVFEVTDLAELAARIDATGGELSAKTEPTLVRRGAGTRAPATPAQLRMLLLDEMSNGTSAYNISNAVRLRGPVDVDALVQAIQAIVARHGSFRTTFQVDGEGYHQIVGPVGEFPVAVVDLEDRPAAERERFALARVRDLLDTPMAMDEGPLFVCEVLRLSADDVVVAFIINHVIYDNVWSSSIFFRELGELYAHFRLNPGASGLDSSLPALEFEFADFAVWEAQRASSQDFTGSIDYWRGKLHGAPAALELPTDLPRPSQRTFEGGVVPFEVPSHVVPLVKGLMSDTGSTPFMVFLAVWQLLLHRYSGQRDVIVGAPAGRRVLPETEGMIGLFINNLALRTQFDGSMSFRDLLAQVRTTSIEAFSHDDVSFERLVDELKPARVPGSSALFQHFFIFRSAMRDGWEIPGLDAEVLEVHQGKAKFDLTLAVREESGAFAGRLEYSSDLFEHSTVERMVQNFLQLLETVVTRPDSNVLQAELVAPAERKLLVETWNDSAMAYDEALLTHQRFERMAAEAPSSVAVRTEQAMVTYAELSQRVDQLAAVLVERGVRPGVLVGVCLDRTLDLVTALLATMKAGGAYVPLDPDFPPQRLTYMLQDSQAKLVITEPRLMERLGDVPAELVAVADALAAPAPEVEPARPGADDVAYVIYTSGSTGNPKGVQVTHRGLLNFLLSMEKIIGVGREDVVQAVTTICFDIAGLELYLPLIVGGSVILSPREVSLSGDSLVESMLQHGATLLQATPATWRMLVQSGWRGTPAVKILCGGEAMGTDLAEDLLGTGCPVWNVYGPTETTIWSSAAQLQVPDDSRFVGEPLANTQLFVMNDGGALQPMGVPGELVIGGDGLAMGYWGREALTAEKFVPHALGSRGRIYRTGDLATRRPNGRLEFLGRKDSQVKIRGFRIELGEIEAAISTRPGVRQAVVGVHGDSPETKVLVAYYVATPGQTVDEAEVHAHLAEVMPRYMLPSAYMQLDALPLTPNAKVDRAQLPAPTARPVGGAPRSASSPDTARHDADRSLLAIFAEVTGRDDVTIDDDFFALGGTSLTALQAIAAVRKMTGLEIPLAQFFASATVRQLADLKEVESDATANIVPLNTAGSGTPIYCVMGVMIYKPLADTFEDQPVYGIFAKRELAVLGEGTKRATIEELAGWYADAIERHDEGRRVSLIGVSFGGLVCLELTNELRRRGFTVENVVALDSVHSNSYYRSPLASLRVLNRLRREQGALGASQMLLEKAAGAIERRRQRQAAREAEGAGQGVPAPVPTEGQNRANAFRAMSQTFNHHNRSYPFDVVLVKATDKSEYRLVRQLKPDYGLGDVVRGHITLLTIESSHLGMLEPDKAPQLHALLMSHWNHG